MTQTQKILFLLYPLQILYFTEFTVYILQITAVYL